VTFEPKSKVWHLGDDAFHECSSLQSIRIPSSITTISPSCFSDCRELIMVVVEAGSHLSAKSLSSLQRKGRTVLVNEDLSDSEE
jgi:hypothetical protein